MKKVIEHVRNKPDHKIHQIIWIITGSVVALLIATWVFIGSKGQEFRVGNFFQSFRQEFQDGRDILDPNILKNIENQQANQ